MFQRKTIALRKETAELVRQFLRERFATRLGLGAEEPAVRVEQRGTTFLASAQARGVTSRCAVCPRVENDHIKEAGELQRVQALVRGRGSDLARGLAMVLDIEPQRQWVVFEYLPGQTFEPLIHAALRRGKLGPVLKPLCRTARLLAQLNRIPAAELGLGQPRTCNGEYAHKLDLSLVDPQIRRWLPQDGRWQTALSRATDREFETRWGESLLLVDCQPKNVVISPAGEARCIDIDYATGNPALNLAHFLVSLDRLGLRHPWPGRQRLVEVCKGVFAHAYLQHMEPWVGQDLAFFYAWLLTRCLRQHASTHPLMAWYLRRRYGSTLRRFLLSLERGTGFGQASALSAAA